MTSCSLPIPEHRARRLQCGATTVLISLTLVLASLLLAIGVAHTTTLEQRMSRNTLLAQQAQQAAAAGLDYGKAWLKSRRPDWVSQPDGTEIATAEPNPPALDSASGGSFAVNLAFERTADWHGYIRVHATASPEGAAEIEARASQFVRPFGVLTAAGEAAPPLVVDGCVDLSGSYDLYPQAADTPTVGPAVISSAAIGCIDTTGTNLHGGTLHGEHFAADALWEYLFTVSREELRELAETQTALDLPVAERDYWWADGADLDSGEWNLSLGSAQRPIVLVIPEDLGCPRFGGGAQIIGLVLIEADCSDAPVWGDVRIYGALAAHGTFASLGSGSHLLHIEHTADRPPRIEPPPLEVVQLAGSWKDFQ